MRFRTRCEAIRAPGREFSIWPSAAPSHSQSVHQFRVLDAESGAIHTEGQLETLDRFFSEANAKDLPEVAMAESTPPSGAMEGRGAYDRHAELPARGGAFALPHFERAVRALPLDTGDQPIVIADYGSSQGKNSLAPMRTAIEALRTRRGADRPIGALAQSGEPERRRAFSDRLEIGLKQSLADRPQPIDSLVETIVLAKSDAECRGNPRCERRMFRATPRPERL